MCVFYLLEGGWQMELVEIVRVVSLAQSQADAFGR